MSDIKSKKLLYLKGFLFLCIGLISFGLILAERPSWMLFGLLVLMIWGFCRAYYFAFYVIEHYVDGDYKFAGLFDFLKYLLSKKSE